MYRPLQGSAPPRPCGRPRKNPPPVSLDTSTGIHNIDVDPCPHVDRDGLLQLEHLQDRAEALEMEIGPAEDGFFDSQEEDFYYND
jgi:hypothetical protein